MGVKLGCPSTRGSRQGTAVCRADSFIPDNVFASSGDATTIEEVGRLRSGNTSHSETGTTHSLTLPYRGGGSECGSSVVNPLDPSRNAYPTEGPSTKLSNLAMRGVALAPAAASTALPSAGHSRPHRDDAPAGYRGATGDAPNAVAGHSAHPAPVSRCAPPTASSTSPTLRAHAPQLARLGLRPAVASESVRGRTPETPQRTLAGACAAPRLSIHGSGDANASNSHLDVSGPFMNNSRRESSLTDITTDDDSSSPTHASISGNLRHSTGCFLYRGEDLELQRQQAPLSIEEDLFIYDDIVISKDEARTKHWRLAGRKPALPLDALTKDGTGSGTRGGSPSAAATKRMSSSGHRKFFSFNDFDVCVDEIDFSIAHSGDNQSTALAALPLDVGLPTSPLDSTQAQTDDEMSTMTSLGSGACGASFYTKLSDRISVMSTVPTAHNTGAALDARAYESSTKVGRVLKDFTYDTIIGHATRVKCIALCPNEKDYASCSNEDASVTLCNLGVRDEVGIFTGHVDTVINTTFSPDGKYLATTSKDKTMILWDVMTTKKLLTFSHAKVVICCCFAPDSKYLVSGCQDRVCRLWDTRRGKEWLSYTQHDGIIIAIAFSPDGNYVCSASADKTLRVWSTSTAKTRFTLSGHTGIILACSYTTDGKHIISNDEASLRVWSTEDGSCTLSLSPSQVAGTTHLTAKGPRLGWTLSCAAPGAFTNYLLVACNNRFVYVVDIDTGKEVHSVFCKAPVYCLTAGTNTMMACGDSFGNIYVLRLK